ncbi:MAG TPA: M14 family metallocarboxypeptidase [Candidatus Saccharimonadales bacterium]|nr:M14 family metallocarboxypeptidase [Candidatus Saccharimonadales bacterium]
MQRLGKNVSSYQGEVIQISEVLAQIDAVATALGWQNESFAATAHQIIPAYARLSPNAEQSIYISAGIHGDEPAGPLAVLRMLQTGVFPEDLNLFVVPCLNPRGFELNRRENEEGLDLNRDYRQPKSAVVSAHIRWLADQPYFNATVCLHEDWEAHGFYLYELNPDLRPSVAEAIIQEVSKVCPIDLSSEIEGRKAAGGIVCANPDLLKRPDWPEAFHLIHHKTRLTYTLESPSDFPLAIRVDALVTGARTLLGKM